MRNVIILFLWISNYVIMDQLLRRGAWKSESKFTAFEAASTFASGPFLSSHFKYNFRKVLHSLILSGIKKSPDCLSLTERRKGGVCFVALLLAESMDFQFSLLASPPPPFLNWFGLWYVSYFGHQSFVCLVSFLFPENCPHHLIHERSHVLVIEPSPPWQ